MEEKPEKKSTLPFIALMFDVSAVALFGLGLLLTRHLFYIAAFCWLFMVIAPFLAIIFGIAALCEGKKRIGVKGIVMSAIAIAAPVILVITLIILFSTGVAVIVWM